MPAADGTIEENFGEIRSFARFVDRLLSQERSRMKLQRQLRMGLAGCLLALTGWMGAPLHAQQSAPEPEAAAVPFTKGLLPPHVAEQVRAIVKAQVKAFLPPAQEGSVEIDRLEKGTVLAATVDGQKYSGKVFRSFLVEPLNPSEFEAMEEYYVRTTAPWPLKAGLVIPADTYLSGMAERASAFDADMIAAQDAAIARSEALSKRALAQLEPERKAKATAIAAAHKGEMDSLAKQIKQLQTEIDKKSKDRENEMQQIARRKPQPTTPVIVRGPNDTILWEWVPGQGFTFNDGLEDSQQKLDEAVSAQKALEATIDAELAAAAERSGAKARAVRTVFRKQSRAILVGEMISDEEMRADYESALEEPLKETPASGTPESPEPSGGKPPIQTVPAPKRGT
jgi:hypothetical protein